MTTLARRRALVVDDDVTFTNALSRWLSQLGCQATVVVSTDAALEQLTQHDFDVLLVDLHLPDGTGHAIIRQLNLAGASIPIIVMSGTSDLDDVVKALRANVADFLRKPFQVDELAAALDGSLKRRTDQAGTPRVITTAATVSAAPAVLPSPTQEHRVDELKPSSLSSAVRPAVAKLMQELRDGTLKLPAPDPMLARLPGMLSTSSWSATEVADLIAHDHNFAVRVLGTANSASFSRGVEIHSLVEACRRLGSKTVLAIGLEILARDYFTSPLEPYRTLLAESWQNAMATARVTRLLAQLLGEDPGELYLIGLLHNIGEQLAITLFAELNAVAGGVSMQELGGEIHQLHESLGAVFASGWKLPSSVVLYAGHHHRPTCEPEPTQQRRVREILLAAWATAVQAGFSYLPGHAQVSAEPLLAGLGLTDRRIALVLEQASKWRAEALVR